MLKNVNNILFVNIFKFLCVKFNQIIIFYKYPYNLDDLIDLPMTVAELLNKISLKDALIVILVAFAGVFYFQMKDYKEQSDKTIIVYNDTIASYKNKLGEECAIKNMYIQQVEDLKRNNESLYAEIKKLKEDPVVVVKTETVFVKDTTYLNTVAEEDSTEYKLQWNLAESYDKYNWFNIEGNTSIKKDSLTYSTYLTNLSIGANLVLDVVETKDKNHFQIITRSDNPNLRFTNIEGAFLDPSKSTVIKNAIKKTNFGFGIYGGYGLSATPGEKCLAGWQIGLGVFWSPNFLRF